MSCLLIYPSKVLGLIHQWITLPVKNDWPVNIPEIQISGGTVMYDAKEVGMRIKNLRKQKGMTQDELAAVFKTESSAICKIETGKQTMSIDYAVDIAAYFEVSIDYLINGYAVVDDEISMAFAQVPFCKKEMVKRLILDLIKVSL